MDGEELATKIQELATNTKVWPWNLVVGGLYRDRSTNDIMTYEREHKTAGDDSQYVFRCVDLPTWTIPIWGLRVPDRVIAISEMEALAWLAR